MKVVLQAGDNFILRFDKGEEVISLLLDFARARNISAAAFSGIGACGEAEIAFYYPATKDYVKKIFAEELEITSLVGNISTLEGSPAVHTHGNFNKTDFSAIGGHVFRVVVSATCEIFLIKLDGEMKRELDKNLNLNLLL